MKKRRPFQCAFIGRGSRASLAVVLCALITGVVLNPVAYSGAGPAKPPFGIGEKLVYQVEWSPPWYLFFLPTVEAGEAELRMAAETEYNGKKALKIVFEARSSGALVRMVGLKVEDHYEFLTDPDSFCTFAVSKKIREGKRKRDIEVIYLPDARQLHIRETDLAVSPPVVRKDEYKDDVPACVKDLFSALYSIRRREFYQGARERSLVGDNDRIKEVEVRVEKDENIDTPAGKYRAWKLNTVALVGGLFKEGGQFNLWLSADERRLPVQFEAKVSLGKILGKIKTIE